MSSCLSFIRVPQLCEWGIPRQQTNNICVFRTVQVPKTFKAVLSWHCGIDVKNNLSIQKAEVGELGDSSPMGDSGKKNKSVSPPGPFAAALLIVRGLESHLKQKKDIHG